MLVFPYLKAPFTQYNFTLDYTYAIRSGIIQPQAVSPENAQKIRGRRTFIYHAGQRKLPVLTVLPGRGHTPKGSRASSRGRGAHPEG